jgi:group II intron reverse transcriptase/maturase
MPSKAMQSLSHHIDLEWLREAHRRTRKDGATGVDGQTAAEFAARLDEELTALLNEAKSGRYRAPPVRRAYIPKGEGGRRPIGIPAYRDKVLQRAVVMALEPVYEQDFHEFSYGFRPGRSAHDALKQLRDGLWSMKGGWVLKVDISSFFDTVDRKRLRDILRQRVVDGVIVRVIGKWLNAGVLEGGVITRSETGTVQGGVISPLLANIYLHEVLDEWWVRDVLPRLRGQAVTVRYADDFVLAFSDEDDARRVQEVLPKRFAKYGLSLHPEKTRLVRFQRPGNDRGERPGTFDFLGFTHYWAKSRKGRWVPKQRTARDRFGRALRKIKEWCRRCRHLPVRVQAKRLGSKLRGHYQYYGLTGNWAALARLYWKVKRVWHKWLSRRSQRAYLNWEAFNRLLTRHSLPRPQVYRSTYRLPAKP